PNGLHPCQYGTEDRVAQPGGGLHGIVSFRESVCGTTTRHSPRARRPGAWEGSRSVRVGLGGCHSPAAVSPVRLTGDSRPFLSASTPDGPGRSATYDRDSVVVGADDLSAGAGREGLVDAPGGAGGELVRAVRVEGHADGQTGLLVVWPGIDRVLKEPD